MRLRRFLTSIGLWAATIAGVAGGLALAIWSSPTPTFAFDHSPIISWRGGGDSAPADAASVGWAGPMFYTAAEDGANPAGPLGLFPTGHLAPGDSVTRVLTVVNIHDRFEFDIDRLQLHLEGDTYLATVLELVIRNDHDEVLFSGSLSNFTLEPSLTFQTPMKLRPGNTEDLTFRVSMDRAADNSYQGRSLKAHLTLLARQVIHPIQIDIHPNSWPNPINPDGRGDLPVSVNGSEGFNVRSLDWRSARFGPGLAVPLRRGYEDWNGDGYEDLILKFDNQAAGFTCGMTEGTLTIMDNSERYYEGSDAIVTPGCK